MFLVELNCSDRAAGIKILAFLKFIGLLYEAFSATKKLLLELLIYPLLSLKVFSVDTWVFIVVSSWTIKIRLCYEKWQCINKKKLKQTVISLIFGFIMRKPVSWWNYWLEKGATSRRTYSTYFFWILIIFVYWCYLVVINFFFF